MGLPACLGFQGSQGLHGPSTWEDRRQQESLRLLSGQMEKLWWPGLGGAGDQLCAALPHCLAFWRVVLDKGGCREHGEEPLWGVWGGEPGEGECTCSGRKKRGEGGKKENNRETGQQLIWNREKGDPIYRTSLPKFPLYSHSRVCAPLEAPEVCEEGMASPGSFALLLHNPAVGHNFKNSMLQQVGTIIRWFPEIVNNCQFVWQGVRNFPHFGFAELAFEIPHQNWNRQTEGRGRLQTFFFLCPALGRRAAVRGQKLSRRMFVCFLMFLVNDVQMFLSDLEEQASILEPIQ